MKRWLAERPALVALAALLAPVVFSVIGLGLTALLPDGQVAGRTLPAFTLRLPHFAADQQAVVPAGRDTVRVPILEYHYVRVNPDPRDQLGFNLSVTPDDFNAQMDWLQANGYHPVDFGDLRAYFKEQKPLPSRAVVLTFDDGYADFYTTALPILESHGFRAVSYVVPGFLDHPRYMTTAQVREIDRAGMQVGAHTVHHVDLTTASSAGLTLEVQGSRNALDQIVGHPVLDFCYPSGKFNATVIAAVRQAGFESATTEQPGIGHTWADRLTWSRVRVPGGEQLSGFATSLGDPEPTVPPSPEV
jgi:peptidoglycan/xylan/chitin deacetylase (PgdA/CDA1 family)